MANSVTIKNNSSLRKRDDKVMEVSFFIDGEYYGAILWLTTRGNQPTISLYSIDEGIQVFTAEAREKRL